MKYACIGEHLRHSFSKEVHNALADYEYEILEIPKTKLDSFMKERDFLGINVTIPYKEAVIPYLYEIDEAAKAIGAVNTIVNKDGKLFGYNTDFYGMRELFRYNNISPKGKKAVILGSGGTAKTARAVLKSLGASEIITVSRGQKGGAISYSELYKSNADAEIMINTTPVGMFPNTYASPVDLDKFPKISGVIDAVYNPLRTTLVSSALKRGIPASSGLFMLVAQAVRASELFTGKLYEEGELQRVYEKILTEKENVVLVGMPSSGKSTVGKELSSMLSREFYDSDDFIEARYGKIGDIFANEGEMAFRNYESEIIAELSLKTGAVIATGGGAVLREANVEALKKNGKIFFLDKALEDLTPTESRPLSSSLEALKKRYEERYPIYESCADFKIEVSGTPSYVCEKIKELI